MVKIIRNQIINTLVQDKVGYLAHSGDPYPLEEMLTHGFSGFEKHTDKELCEGLEDVQEEDLLSLHKQIGKLFIKEVIKKKED